MIDKECLFCKRFSSKSCNGVEDRNREQITDENRCSGFLLAITDENLQMLHTDSDVMDLADELGISYRKLDFEICMKFAEGTPCYGCKNVVFSPSMPPCTSCSRDKKDLFEGVED